MSSFKTVLNGFQNKTLKDKIKSDHQYDLYSINLLCLNGDKPYVLYSIYYDLTRENKCNSNIKHDFRFNHPYIITDICSNDNSILNNVINNYNKNVDEIINNLQDKEYLTNSKKIKNLYW